MYSDLVGWSDIELFIILENRHYAADQVYFYKFKSKKSATISLSKNHKGP